MNKAQSSGVEGVDACEAPSWPNFTDSEADIARLFPIWQTKDEKGRDCPLVRLVDLVGVVQATYGERAERDRAVASWKKAAGRLTAHWKANGPAVEAQWCTHAAQLLSMGDELLTHGVDACEASSIEDVVKMVYRLRTAVRTDSGAGASREAFEVARKAEGDLIDAIRALGVGGTEI